MFFKTLSPKIFLQKFYRLVFVVEKTPGKAEIAVMPAKPDRSTRKTKKRDPLPVDFIDLLEKRQFLISLMPFFRSIEKNSPNVLIGLYPVAEGLMLELTPTDKKPPRRTRTSHHLILRNKELKIETFRVLFSTRFFQYFRRWTRSAYVPNR